MRDMRQVRLEHFGSACKFRPELRALGGDPDRASVEVAGPHHDAPFRQQRRGAEAVFVGAQQRGEEDVAARLDATVDAQADPAAQPVDS